MRILVVHDAYLDRFPPVINLIWNLLHNGHTVTLITRDATQTNEQIQHPDFHAILLPICHDNSSLASQTYMYLRRNRAMRNYVRQEMEHNDILWTTTDTTVRALGSLVFNYKHIMQLMELIYKIPRFPNINHCLMSLAEYAQKAYKVVVPEYNRAHILKTWYKLDKLPSILPNKPYITTIKDVPDYLKPFISEMQHENRKIILYQGVFYPDRKLDVIAEAVHSISNHACLYFMGRDTEMRQAICKRFPEVKYIGFVQPPYHLHITKNADIGLLPYIPQKVAHYSELNALYCAPNKIYEYSAFGLPMLGSDVPGLKYPFDMWNIGQCCDISSAEDIVSKISQILQSYDTMTANCHNFFNSIDLDEIVSEILK